MVSGAPQSGESWPGAQYVYGVTTSGAAVPSGLQGTVDIMAKNPTGNYQPVGSRAPATCRRGYSGARRRMDLRRAIADVYKTRGCRGW